MREKNKLPDVQSKKINSIKLNRVGVSGMDFPIYIRSKKGEKILCYAKVNMYVSLRRNVKGTNMSRLPRLLMKYRYTSFSRWVLWKFLYDLKKYSDTTDAYAEIKFKYFVDKKAPVTKEVSVMAYDCTFIGHVSDTSRYIFHLKVGALGTSNCPCSKEISKYGAHGQRSRIVVTVETKRKKTIWLEDLIKLIEREFSYEIYPVLKRPDEKFVTEKAYENPKFVEDIVRRVGLALQKTKLFKWYKVKVENFESIHTHNAIAYIERTLKGRKWRSTTKSLRRMER